MPSPVFVPLAAGLETELTAQLVQPGATLLAENCVSDKTGQTRVRLGGDFIATNTQGTLPTGGLVPAVWQLATLGGGLARFNRAPVPLHTWASSPRRWVRPSSTVGGVISYRRGPIKVDTSAVLTATTSDENAIRPDIAVSDAALVSVIQTTGGGVDGTAVVLLDRNTRRPIYTRQTGTATRAPRVVIVGTRAVVAYENGTNLIVDSFDLKTYTFAETVTLGLVLSGTAIDVRVGSPVVGSNNVAIIYRDNAGVLQCATVDATNLATNSTFTPRTPAPATVSPNIGFGWMQDFGASLKFSIMIADTVNGLRTLWDLPAPAAGFSNAAALHVLDATATATPSGGTAGIRNIIGTTLTSNASGQYRVMYEVTAPSTPSRAMIVHGFWNVASWTAEGTQIRSVGIRSKFWRDSSPANNYFFLAAFDSADQRSYFVIAVTPDLTTDTTFPAPLAVAMPRDAGGLTEGVNSMSSAAAASDGSIYVAATSEVRTESIASAGTATGITQRILAVDAIRIRHDPSPAETEYGKPTEFIKTLFVPGGLLGAYDGLTYGMAGLPYYPPKIAPVLGGAGGNLTPSATYRYVAVYSFIDRNQRKWRSAPSASVSAQTNGTNFKIDVTTDTLRLVDRGYIGTILSAGYQVEIYRTQANSTAGFFLVAAYENDHTATSNTQSITDNVADSALGEELYTDGGGVENQLLPSISNAVEYQGRLVVSQAGTGTLWYSVEADFDTGLIFNEALTLDVGDPTDPITGLAVFGEQLFAFKSGKIYIVAGEGANSLGQGGNYTPRLVDPSIGCNNPQSIVVADDGVWFRSGATRAGIHRTSGGKSEYVGRGVHAYDNLTITGAVVVREKTEIRFYTLTGTTLVWNWTAQIWETNTGQPCLSATSGYADGIVYARADDGSVLVEATSSAVAPYREGQVAYTGKIRTPWYQAGGLAGWQRIKRMQGVGNGGDRHKTVIRLYKDLATSPFFSPSLTFDGTAQRWNWEIRPAQQKASAMMIEVEIQSADPAGPAVTPDAGDQFATAAPRFIFVNSPGFTSAHIGYKITIVGTTNGTAGYDGTYTITGVVNGFTVNISPSPFSPPGTFLASAILVYPSPPTGPEMIGVSLLPMSKEGMDKVPATRRPT